MKFSRILAILLAITCVGLGAATLNLIQQNQELNAQLTAIDSARQANFPGMWPGDRAVQNGGLRQALESEQEANAELRRELAKLKGEPIPPKATPPPAPTVDTTRQNRGSGGSEAWLEQIKQQDPERYKQIVAERDQRRKEAQDWYTETLGQLQARAQSPASPDEAALVTQISDTLAKLNDLRQQMQAARQLPDAERQAQLAQLMPEMQTAWQDLTKLREQDRALQYLLLGKQLGLSDDKAQSLATSIPVIHQNTQYTPRGSGGFGGSSNAGMQPPTPGR
ncbi:MAG: hypothetical protein WCS70_15015 [Verrucomicrobiota bacterium]